MRKQSRSIQGFEMESAIKNRQSSLFMPKNFKMLSTFRENGKRPSMDKLVLSEVERIENIKNLDKRIDMLKEQKIGF